MTRRAAGVAAAALLALAGARPAAASELDPGPESAPESEPESAPAPPGDGGGSAFGAFLAASVTLGGGGRATPADAAGAVFELGGQLGVLLGTANRGLGLAAGLRTAGFHTVEPSLALEGMQRVGVFRVVARIGGGWAIRPRIEDGSFLLGTLAFGVREPAFWWHGFLGTVMLYASVRRSLDAANVTEVTGGLEFDPASLVLYPLGAILWSGRH